MHVTYSVLPHIKVVTFISISPSLFFSQLAGPRNWHSANATPHHASLQLHHAPSTKIPSISPLPTMQFPPTTTSLFTPFALVYLFLITLALSQPIHNNAPYAPFAPVPRQPTQTLLPVFRRRPGARGDGGLGKRAPPTGNKNWARRGEVVVTRAPGKGEGGIEIEGEEVV